LMNSRPFSLMRAHRSVIATGYSETQCNGLGVVYKSGYAVCTFHQVDPKKISHSISYIFWLSKDGAVQKAPLKVLEMDKELDLAIIECPIGPKVCTLATPCRGQNIQMFCNSGPVGSFRDKIEFVTAGAVVKIQGPTMYHESSSFQGQSGSPVFFGNACVGIHKEGSSKFGAATVLSSDVIAWLLGFTAPGRIVKESYDSNDYVQIIEQLQKHGVNKDRITFKVNQYGDEEFSFRAYMGGRYVADVYWRDGDFYVLSNDGEKKYSGMYEMFEGEYGAVSGSQFNMFDEYRGAPNKTVNGGFRGRTQRGNERGKSKKGEFLSNSGYKDKSKSRARNQTVNLNKNVSGKSGAHFMRQHSLEIDGEMKCPISEMVNVAGQHDGFKNDQKDPNVSEVKDYSNWTVAGSCPEKFFAKPDLVMNPIFADIVKDLPEEIKNAYSYAPCDKSTLLRCFKTYADVSIKRDDDLGAWASFLRSVLPNMGPKSHIKYKLRTVNEAWEHMLSHGLDKKASGYPFNCADSPCGVPHPLKGGVRECKVCWAAICEDIDAICNDGVPERTCVAVGDVNCKPEFLKKKKIEQGRTRMVICANFVQVIVQVMLSQGFESVKAQWPNSWNRVGMCVARGGLQRIARELDPLPYKQEMDAPQFDLTQISEIQAPCVDAMAETYGIDLNDQNTKNAFNWVKNVMVGPKQWRVNDMVLVCDEANFNSSGNLWTAELNCNYMASLTIRSWFDSVPTLPEFYAWFYTTGRYMNKYGDDSLDGSLVEFPAIELQCQRMQRWGSKITPDDIKQSKVLKGMGFLGYTFDDSPCGVSFNRWPKSLMNLLYMPNDPIKLFCAVQSMRLNFAGNAQAQAIAKKCESVVPGIPGQMCFTDEFVEAFWTGRESFVGQTEMSGKQIFDESGEDVFYSVSANVRQRESKEPVVQELRPCKASDIRPCELSPSGGSTVNAEVVAGNQLPITISELSCGPGNKGAKSKGARRRLNRLVRLKKEMELLRDTGGKSSHSNAYKASEEIKKENKDSRKENAESDARTSFQASDPKIQGGG